jgi:GT2 family glycosyltransferase
VTALLVVHAATLTVLLALVAQTALNLRRLPRLAAMPAPPACPRVAVLIPARNEAACIADAVTGWTRQDYPDFEIVVYDDDSADDTRARALAAGDGRVRVVAGRGLPPGWSGKAHACHRLRQATDAALLVFADADVTAAPSALTRTVGAFATLGVDALSALPRHAGERLAIRALTALQNWAPLAFVPRWLAAARRRPAFAVMNGQFLALRAATYDAAGGFAAVRGSVGEDTALGRRLVALGHAIALVDGSRVLTCHPYRTFRALWAAHVRNLTTAFLGSPALLVAAVGALAAITAGPAVVLVAGAVAGGAGAAWTWLPLAELGLAAASRALTDARAGYGLALAPLHPLAVLALLGMALDAGWRAARGDTVEWRGRRYGVTDAPE